MEENNVRMSDEELLEFRMFQEQMKNVRHPELAPAQLSRKEEHKCSYVARSLSSDEFIAKVALLHPFAYFGSFILFCIGLFLIYTKFIDTSFSKLNNYLPHQEFIAYFCFFIAFIKYLKLHMIEMVVTNKRVICKEGIIAVNTEELKNTRIESVEIKQTLWQRLWKYADIYFTGTGGSYVLFSNIKDAREVKSMLEDSLDV